MSIQYIFSDENILSIPHGDFCVISYEFPLNEKVRTMLRLEDLFARITHFAASQFSVDHHVALTTLFEILEVASRADLKLELLQELERQKRTLSNLHNNPAISEFALDSILLKIEKAAVELLAMTGKIGQHLRDNEWLMGIKQRAGLPGGTCDFDLPSYHYWQEQSSQLRRDNLQQWLAPLLPLSAAIEIVLRLLRESGKVLHFTAHNGTFQQMQGGRVAQLLRVSLSAELICLPEVSANKYAINIRFVDANYAAKSTVFNSNVHFELTFCSLAP